MRFISYLSPWLPAEFFRVLLRGWERHLEEPCELMLEERFSGPTRAQVAAGEDPLSSGQAEAGIICAPTYLWARRHNPPRVQLAGWVPVFQDLHRPVYHSLVLVPQDSPAQALSDLREAKWSFNDPCSLSGYHSVLASLGGDTSRLQARAVYSGGHEQSLALLASGHAEACAVDANGWFMRRKGAQHDKLRVVAELGPFPAQPIVFSAAVGQERLQALATALESTVQDSRLLKKLQEEFGLVRFVASDEELLRDLSRVLES